jgi:hypothetical protein
MAAAEPTNRRGSLRVAELSLRADLAINRAQGSSATPDVFIRPARLAIHDLNQQKRKDFVFGR